MNTLHIEPIQRCFRHPHQRIVGVCAACLRERLNALAEYSRITDAQIYRNYTATSHGPPQQHPAAAQLNNSCSNSSNNNNNNAKQLQQHHKLAPHSNAINTSSTRSSVSAVVHHVLNGEAAPNEAATSCSSLPPPSKLQRRSSAATVLTTLQIPKHMPKLPPPREEVAKKMLQGAAQQITAEEEDEEEVVKEELVPGPQIKPETTPSFQFLLHERPTRAIAINVQHEDEHYRPVRPHDPHQENQELLDGRSYQVQEEERVSRPGTVLTTCENMVARDSPLMISCGRRSADGVVGRKSTDGVFMGKPSTLLVSTPEVKDITSTDCAASRKKKASSWFSLSKPKSNYSSNGAIIPPRKPSSKPAAYVDQNGVLIASTPARKSGSDPQASLNFQSMALNMTADLESISEISLAADQEQSHASSLASSSWFSSLFHMRRSSKATRSSKSTLDFAVETSNVNYSGFSNGVSVNHSPKVSIDAGRLSWDGPRSNFRHILRKLEARNHSNTNPQQPPQLNNNSCPIKSSNDVTLASLLAVGSSGKDYQHHHQLTSLPKCKSVSSARSSISVEMNNKHGFNPVINGINSQVITDHNGLVSDQDDRNFPRSRSLGQRAWTKTLSPLLGLKQHAARKG